LSIRRSLILYSSSTAAENGNDTKNHSDDDNIDTELGCTDTSRRKNNNSKIKSINRPSLWEEIGTSDSSSYDDDDEDNTRLNFSKLRWKKKSYLMMQDVKKEIKKNRQRAPQMAEEVALRLQKWYDEVKDEIMEEDDHIDAEEHRESLLGYLQSTLLRAYNLWIHALARSGQEGAGYRAEDILMRMKENKITPNEITYSSIIDAYARCPTPSDSKISSVQAAEDFLFRLLQTSRSGGEGIDSSLTCDSILNVWAQEENLESVERAQMILYTMEDWQDAKVRPTKHSYATGT
jgi:hypothetical protein